MQEIIKNYFTESIQTQVVMAEALSETIECAAAKLVQVLLNGNKIFACGNGSSAANAQQFVAKLMNGIEIARPSIPAVALVCDNVLISSIANNGQYDDVYVKQLQALAVPGDILVVLSSQGSSFGVVQAVQEAVVKDMTIIALTGCDGGEIVGLLGQNDIELRVPSYQTLQIQEMHAMVLNCLCRLIEHALFNV